MSHVFYTLNYLHISYILITFSPILLGFLYWREFWEDVGLPSYSGLLEVLSWLDVKSRDLRTL
ncbi:hypothetical protein COCC4DRAFT_155163 [Bipolaris maydis ATCC 48331]|uniref:Uncharacterized protein n=1 Tax=Cochliobolus heterostrophus (strain C4 / ATCC 48331 / race T) TaxID=665024 RepID=N4WWD1_COCH4|nr:uncharacterized protein COCC4DRAFT_155163 [Bipolaris maydis ATCC 48331]ENH98690.1 hypothetical protein COCC4DRAFT_155163 [Bipolaris maydis ATCC 48331]